MKVTFAPVKEALVAQKEEIVSVRAEQGPTLAEEEVEVSERDDRVTGTLRVHLVGEELKAMVLA